MLLAAGWMLAALFRDGFGWIGVVMFAVFAMVGLYLTYGIAALDMRCRNSTRYLVTDRRIVIESESPFVDVGSVPLLRLDGKPQMLKIAVDGTIHLGYPLFSYLARFWGPIHRLVMNNPRLDCLEHPLQVYHVIRSAQHRLLSAEG